VPCSVTFSDVPEGYVFYPYIRWLACRQVISGYSDGTFRPGNTVTRGQLLKMVVNAAGWTPAHPAAPTFADVAADNPFYSFIETGVAHGIISGYSCGGPGEPCPGLYFRPGADITRGQLSKVIALARGYALPAAGPPAFADVSPGHPFFAYVEAMAAHGVVSGYRCGDPGEPCPGLYFRPGNSATRGQVSKFATLAYGGP
jgi:hypothetical protein